MTLMARMKEEIETALQGGVRWLSQEQGPDGGWHSATYGQLKDGAAVTALAMYALAHLPEKSQSDCKQAWSKASEFLGRGIAKRGTIASPNGTLDFPTYAAALWLTAQRRWLAETSSVDNRRTITNYLLAAQIAEPRGFERSSPSYGGWDFLGAEDARGITTGTNVSVTAYVVEVLADEQASRQRTGNREPGKLSAALSLAKEYVLRCQQPDGGFAFTCEPASLNNKAAYRDEKLTQPRSYGTATADGIRALLACGARPTDEPVAKALTWLSQRPGLEIVPGFEVLPPEAGWQRGLRFYYYASLAPILRHYPDTADRKKALAEHVVALQSDDGSWMNSSDRMRENDPLIATSLAVVALAECA
jgi:prenyltransferase beta subunit